MYFYLRETIIGKYYTYGYICMYIYIYMSNITTVKAWLVMCKNYQTL